MFGGGEENVRGTARLTPDRAAVMKEGPTGRPTQLMDSSLGARDQSRVNKTSREVFGNAEQDQSLRETPRNFRRELRYTSKADIRKKEVPGEASHPWTRAVTA